VRISLAGFTGILLPTTKRGYKVGEEAMGSSEAPSLGLKYLLKIFQNFNLMFMLLCMLEVNFFI